MAVSPPILMPDKYFATTEFNMDNDRPNFPDLECAIDDFYGGIVVFSATYGFKECGDYTNIVVSHLNGATVLQETHSDGTDYRRIKLSVCSNDPIDEVVGILKTFYSIEEFPISKPRV